MVDGNWAKIKFVLKIVKKETLVNKLKCVEQFGKWNDRLYEPGLKVKL